MKAALSVGEVFTFPLEIAALSLAHESKPFENIKLWNYDHFNAVSMSKLSTEKQPFNHLFYI